MGLVSAGLASSAGYAGTALAQETPVVAMTSNEFDPIGLAIEPGTTVRFEIESGSHSATTYEVRIPAAADPFDSGTISSGGFEHTFDEPGTYDYYCTPHRSMGMVGRIVVGDPGGPAEDSPIPDGAVPDSEEIVEAGAIGADEFGGASGGHGEMMDGEAGMMGSGPGMMWSGGSWWLLLVPVSFFTLLASVVGGVAYWASRKGSAAGGGRSTHDGSPGVNSRSDSALDVLDERFARGEIDEEEYERRRERIARDD